MASAELVSGRVLAALTGRPAARPASGTRRVLETRRFSADPWLERFGLNRVRRSSKARSSRACGHERLKQSVEFRRDLSQATLRLVHREW
jgi:hypothetical protein